MKLSHYVKKISVSLEADQRNAIRADLETGDLSDIALAVEDYTEQSADYARELVEATGIAREAHSDAIEFGEIQQQLEVAREGIAVVNSNGGFTLESLQWAERAVNAILLPLDYKVQFQLDSPALESITAGGKIVLSMENIEEVIQVVEATKQDVENLSVDGILRVLAVLEDAIPDVKDRLVALHQSIRTLDYDDEKEITLDDVIFKALSVNGQLPVGLRDYFIGYQNFVNKILSTYTENAIESASKADFLADALNKLGENDCPIKAISKAVDEVGDPRKVIDTDQLAFVLPGSGPLFGNKVSIDDDADEIPASGGSAPALTEEQTDQPGAGMEPPEGDPLATGAPDPVEEEEEEVQVAAPAAADDATSDAIPPTDDAVAPPAEGAPAAEPTEEVPPAEEPATPAPAEGSEPAAPAPAPVEGSEEPTPPTEGSEEAKPASVVAPKSNETEEEEEDEEDEQNTNVLESQQDNPAGSMEPVDALIVKLEKFSSNYAALDPMSWEDREAGSNPTIRVLSKDTIEAVLGELIKCLEVVNIKSYAESHRQTWSKARTAFGAYKKSFDSLTPQQAADISRSTEAVGEYLNTVFTLSAWPALHTLTNLVFVCNAFLLLAERSISGESATPDTDTEFDESDVEGDGDETTSMTDEEAAAAAQATNDAMAGSRAADEGAVNDATLATGA